MKTYSAKSSAIRAAKKAHGAAWETKASIQAAESGWQIISVEADDGHMTEAPTLTLAASAPRPLIDRLTIVKSPWGGHAKAPWVRNIEPAKANQLIERLESLVEKLEHLPLLQEGDAIPEDKGDAVANRLAMGWKLSSAQKPTKLVHIIASEMPNASRKEVIEACIAAGVAPGTARTQYQAFYSARKADEQRRSNSK